MIIAVKKMVVIILSAILILYASFSFVCAMDFDAETIYDSVFVVYSGDALGSGFAVGENSIITNAHIISADSQTEIETYKGDSYDVEIYSIDEERDLAILIASDLVLKPLKISDLKQLSIGDDVYAIGAPECLGFTLTKGIVSSLNREYEGRIFIQTDAPINAGNSGGPLLNNEGDVVGINSYRISQSDGLGLAIPSDQIHDYLSSLDISIDDNGNVIGKLNVSKKQIVEEDEPPLKDGENNMSVIVGLSIGLGISVILNIALIILLIRNSKKNNIVNDSSDRTDFEIDILE